MTFTPSTLKTLAVVVASQLVGSSFLAGDEQSEIALITSRLVGAARDKDVQVRQAAMRALRAQPSSPEVVEAFRQGIKDADPSVRATAVAGFVESQPGSEESLKLLVSLIDDQHVGGYVHDQLKRLGDPAVPLLVGRWQQHENSRAAIASVFGSMQLRERRGEVVGLLSGTLAADKDPMVRIAAVRALSNISQRLSSTVSRFPDARTLQFSQGVVAKYDTNGDGALTEDEWQLMPKNPKVADTDKDGRITAAELSRWLVDSGGTAKK